MKSFMLAEKQDTANVNSLPFENVDPESANRYPMRDAPIPVKDIDFIVASQAELIRRLSDAVPLSTDEFNRYLFPSIKRLAAFVHLLPASNNYHHKGRGGLFRHSLEVALFTVNSAKHHIFENNQVPAAAYYNKGRWFVACTIAALMHDIGKTILNVTVSGKNGTLLWHPLSSSLYDWAKSNDLNEYYLVWKKEDSNYESHESVGASLLYPLVDQVALDYIVASNSQVLMTEFLESLSGIARPGAIIANLVKNADALSTKRDVRHMSLDSKVTSGVDSPIAAILEDIMVQLIERNVWKANDWTEEKKSFPALWLTDEGAFLHWPVAVKDIVNELNRRGIASIPRDPLTLAEKLCEGGVCETLHPEVTAEAFWQMLPMKIVRPKIEEQINEETGEVKKVYLDEKGAPYQYRFLQCVKIVDIQRFFAHKARPSAVTAVVISVPVSLEKMRLWRSKTLMQPPQTQMEDQDLTPDLIQEADRKAMTLETNNQVFDRFGNPLPFMPTLEDEEWMDIELNNSISEMEGVSYADVAGEEERENSPAEEPTTSHGQLLTEEINPVDWPGLSSQKAVSPNNDNEETLIEQSGSEETNEAESLSEQEQAELQASLAEEAFLGVSEDKKPLCEDNNEEETADEAWIQAVTDGIEIDDVTDNDDEEKVESEEIPIRLSKEGNTKKEPLTEEPKEQQLNKDKGESDAKTSATNEVVDVEKAPVVPMQSDVVSNEQQTNHKEAQSGEKSVLTDVEEQNSNTMPTLDAQFLANMMPKLERTHKNKTSKKKRNKQASQLGIVSHLVNRQPSQEKVIKKEKKEETKEQSTGLLADGVTGENLQNEVKNASECKESTVRVNGSSENIAPSPLPTAIVNDPDFALLTFDDRSKLTLDVNKKEVQDTDLTLHHPEEKETVDKKKSAATSPVKELKSPSADNMGAHMVAQMVAAMTKVLSQQLREGKGSFICLYAQEGSRRSISCQKVRELIQKKGFEWTLFIEAIKDNTQGLQFDDDHQRFFIDEDE